jgi:hypothetical protein
LICEKRDGRRVALSTRPARLHEMAASFLDMAREEAAEGYRLKDERRIRDAAEKAWLAALQAIDGARQRHGEVLSPGAMAHQDRHDFLKGAGRRDLSKLLSIFADQLHGQVFYIGAIPKEKEMKLALDEVLQFTRIVRDEL